MDRKHKISNNIQATVTALQQLTLSKADLAEQERARHFQDLDYAETQQKLEDLKVPADLLVFIPRAPGAYHGVKEETRKNKRGLFSLYKAFPPAQKFTNTRIRNKKLASAIKTQGQHFQSNNKHILAGIIEVGTEINEIGKRLKSTIYRHQDLPEIFRQAFDRNQINLQRRQHLESVIQGLRTEFQLYISLYEGLKATYDKCVNLALLQEDSIADGLRQIEDVIFAIQHLSRPKTDIRPTPEDYKEARQSGRNNRFNSFPNHHRRRGFRGRGRGRRSFRGRNPYFQGRSGPQQQYNQNGNRFGNNPGRP